MSKHQLNAKGLPTSGKSREGFYMKTKVELLFPRHVQEMTNLVCPPDVGCKHGVGSWSVVGRQWIS